MPHGFFNLVGRIGSVHLAPLLPGSEVPHAGQVDLAWSGGAGDPGESATHAIKLYHTTQSLSIMPRQENARWTTPFPTRCAPTLSFDRKPRSTKPVGTEGVEGIVLGVLVPLDEALEGRRRDHGPVVQTEGLLPDTRQRDAS